MPDSQASGPATVQVVDDGAGVVDDLFRPPAPRPGITPRIARRGIAHGSGLGKIRWVVERAFAWLHAFNRLRTRYERRADIHLGLLELACVLICRRRLAPSS